MDINEKVKLIIENIIDDKIHQDITSLRLIEDLQLSSLEILLLVIDIEKEFKINIEQEEIYRISSIGELIKLIKKLSHSY